MKLQKKYAIYGIVSVLVLLIGFSLAYFTIRIVGIGKEVSVTAKDLKVVFTDDAGIDAADILPGWSTSKTFTIKNESGNEYKYDIIIQDLVNTFVTEGFLQYKITSIDGGHNMTTWKNVPKSDVATDTILVHSVVIADDDTHTYTIHFNYPNSELVNQSPDMGKIFSGKMGITYGTTPPGENFFDKLLADNPTRLTRESFDTVLTTTNVGVLYTQSGNFTEDVTGDGVGETVYYFAGNAQNNWVKFGKALETSCTYEGNPVPYANITTQTTKQSGLTESECTGTNLCKLEQLDQNGEVTDTIYGTGLSSTECTFETMGYPEEYADYFRVTYTDQKATYDSGVKDLYWRIIRTNEDGGVRLLYTGTSPNTTNASIITSAFNGTSEDRYHDTYSGYMYGTEGSLANNRLNTNDSTIKSVIDTWYNNELNTRTDGIYAYNRYISRTAIYCNDRSTDAWYGINSDNNNTHFGAFNRLYTYGAKPSYRCGNTINGTLYSNADVADRFSVSTTSGGNGKLTYPIALMTADELVYAGSRYYTSTALTEWAWYHLNSEGSPALNTSWWTMSPSNLNYKGSNYLYTSEYDSYLMSSAASNASYVRPVLSLKSCVLTYAGDGSSASPYEVTIDVACAAADN